MAVCAMENGGQGFDRDSGEWGEVSGMVRDPLHQNSRDALDQDGLGSARFRFSGSHVAEREPEDDDQDSGGNADKSEIDISAHYYISSEEDANIGLEELIATQGEAVQGSCERAHCTTIRGKPGHLRNHATVGFYKTKKKSGRTEKEKMLLSLVR